jgi:hypothetical protein
VVGLEVLGQGDLRRAVRLDPAQVTLSLTASVAREGAQEVAGCLVQVA